MTVELAALRAEAEEREAAGDWVACEPQQMLALIEAVEAAQHVLDMIGHAGDGFDGAVTELGAAIAPFRVQP